MVRGHLQDMQSSCEREPRLLMEGIDQRLLYPAEEGHESAVRATLEELYGEEGQGWFADAEPVRAGYPDVPHIFSSGAYNVYVTREGDIHMIERVFLDTKK